MNEFLKQKNKTLIVISHYKRIFNYLKANKVFIISKGKLSLEGDEKLIDKLEEKGYSILKNASKN